MRMCDLAAACACHRAGSPAASTGSSATGWSSAVPHGRPAGDARPPHRGRLRPDDGVPRRTTSPACAATCSIRWTPRRSTNWRPSSRPSHARLVDRHRQPDDGRLAAPAGFRAHVANVGIKDDTDDFTVVAAEAPCAAAGVFTRSSFAGPSVVVSRRNIAERPRAGRRRRVEERQRRHRRAGPGRRRGTGRRRRRPPRLLGRRGARRLDRRDRPALPDGPGPRRRAAAIDVPLAARRRRGRGHGDHDHRHRSQGRRRRRSPARRRASSAWPRASG